ncbi:hypothetical protein [Microbacterium sp. Se5.02b]|nr:hypothetical protein [Microbacterium sp. Se5.02b]QYM64824.1 hypothetical protein K1X59_02775 [Microbacterium sp. Se5.02b]
MTGPAGGADSHPRPQEEIRHDAVSRQEREAPSLPQVASTARHGIIIRWG